jgi:hypothetical protein
MKLETIVQRLIEIREQAEDERTRRKLTALIQDIQRNDFGRYY